MAPQSKKILVIGATGLIGKDLLQALINTKNEFEKIGIFTSANTVATKKAFIADITSAGVEVIVGDIDNETDVLDAYKGYDTVVSAVGRNAIEKQIQLIALAEKTANIVRFFPSEFGTDIEYDATSAGEPTHQKKLKVRAYIASDAVSRLAHTYVVTGPFADMFLTKLAADPKVGSWDVAGKSATLLGDGKGRISFTSQRDVGKLLVAALLHPDYADGKALKVNSFTTTPDEILAEFEKQTSGKWSVSYTSLEELREREKKAYSEGSPLTTAYTLRRIWTEGKTLYEKRDNEAIGATDLDTLETVVKEAIARAS